MYEHVCACVPWRAGECGSARGPGRVGPRGCAVAGQTGGRGTLGERSAGGRTRVRARACVRGAGARPRVRNPPPQTGPRPARSLAARLRSHVGREPKARVGGARLRGPRESRDLALVNRNSCVEEEEEGALGTWEGRAVEGGEYCPGFSFGGLRRSSPRVEKRPSCNLRPKASLSPNPR